MEKHDAILALEYAANYFDRESHRRRSVFIMAYVEGEQWAVDDLERWKSKQKPND